MMKCVVVYNPQSGKLSKRDAIKPMRERLEKYGYDMKLVETKCRGDAINIIKKLGKVDLVICAGGDGTLNEVITGNLERKDKLVIAQLPLGTMNDVAHMYGMSQNLINNLEMILSGVKKKIDVCLINGATFVYVAALGAYVDISYSTPRKLKEKYGRLGYIIYGIKQLKKNFNFYNVKYKINNKTYEKRVSFIFITNSNRVAGVNNLFPDVKLNDNMFEVMMCDIRTKWDILKTLYRLKRRDINNIPEFTYYKTDRLEIEFDEIPSSWCIDGDELVSEDTTFTIEVNKEITMLLPSKNITKLFEEKDN